MANLRKFSDKIAMHSQKMAEETAAFEQIMREVGSAVVQTSFVSSCLSPTACQDGGVAQVSLPQHSLLTETTESQASGGGGGFLQPLQRNCGGGSLPNVNHAATSCHTAALFDCDAAPSAATLSAETAGASISPPQRQDTRSSSVGPYRGPRSSGECRRDASPYRSGGSRLLSPPVAVGAVSGGAVSGGVCGQWRRTHSDSALNQSAAGDCDLAECSAASTVPASLYDLPPPLQQCSPGNGGVSTGLGSPYHSFSTLSHGEECGFATSQHWNSTAAVPCSQYVGSVNVATSSCYAAPANASTYVSSLSCGGGESVSQMTVMNMPDGGDSCHVSNTVTAGPASCHSPAPSLHSTSYHVQSSPEHPYVDSGVDSSYRSCSEFVPSSFSSHSAHSLSPQQQQQQQAPASQFYLCAHKQSPRSSSRSPSPAFYHRSQQHAGAASFTGYPVQGGLAATAETPGGGSQRHFLQQYSAGYNYDLFHTYRQPQFSACSPPSTTQSGFRSPCPSPGAAAAGEPVSPAGTSCPASPASNAATTAYSTSPQTFQLQQQFEQFSMGMYGENGSPLAMTESTEGGCGGVSSASVSPPPSSLPTTIINHHIPAITVSDLSCPGVLHDLQDMSDVLPQSTEPADDLLPETDLSELELQMLAECGSGAV